MFAALRGALEVLESAVGMAVERAVPTLMPLWDHAVCVAESVGKERGLVTLCSASTGRVEGAVLHGVVRPCVDGWWVKGTAWGELEWRVVLWSR